MAEASLWFELQQLYARYGELLDDGPLEQWPELFCDPCLYLLQPRDNFDLGLPLAIMRCESRAMLRDRVRAVQETIMHEPRYLRHYITGIRVREREQETLDATANFMVVEVLQDDLPRILCCGRYLDRLRRDENDCLRFEEKRCIYDSVLVPNTIVYPV